MSNLTVAGIRKNSLLAVIAIGSFSSKRLARVRDLLGRHVDAGLVPAAVASMTKPIVAACAMALFEDCTLRLDAPVDALLPELADMTVLADPGGRWKRPSRRNELGRPPAFESGGGGLVSTASDYLELATALRGGGTHHGERMLSRPSVTLMTSDHLTPAQKAVSGRRISTDNRKPRRATQSAQQ
jgi:CubicO group peptidase (beta-lactamase class C family)